ncbi:MAG: C10 family peptidase [Prevotellaceae bacterium]|nr:C10 family peptidase [Prevotellaceae bacterium]
MRLKLLTVFAFAYSLIAWGTQLTPEQALKRYQNSDGKSKVKSLNSGLKLAYTAEAEGMNACYVYNNGNDGGFVILSADDSAPALLGYSDSGTFDVTAIPSNMKAWLDGYAREIAAASAAETSTTDATGFTADAISPLLTTQWGQSSPYNNECPQLYNIHTMTGSVATAMAQVMNYHEWPAQGTGSVNYTYELEGKEYTMSKDLSDYVFDWTNMADTYGSESTDEQKDAVATLMAACGASVEMKYGFLRSNTSVAKSLLALYKNFNYDSGIKSALRTCYGSDGWNELIYSELANKRPVMLVGVQPEYGEMQAFVCDGYDGAGYFHINWGWSGTSDGYFLLSSLAPSSKGIGSGSEPSDFSSVCYAFLGVQPPVEDSEVAVNWYGYGIGVSDNETVETVVGNVRDADLNFKPVATSYDEGYTCMTVEPMTLTPGLRLYDLGSEDIYFIGCNEGAKEYSIGDKITDITISGTNLPEGTYMITPALKAEEGNIYAINFSVNGEQMMYLQVKTDSVFISISGFTPVLEAELANTVDMIDLSLYNELNVKVANGGLMEYFGNIYPKIYGVDANNELDLLATGTGKLISVSDGSETNVQFDTKFTLNDESIALSDYTKYYIQLFDEYDKPISDTLAVASIIENIKLLSLSVNSNDAGYVDPYDVKVNAEFTGKANSDYYIYLKFDNVNYKYSYGVDVLTDSEGYAHVAIDFADNTQFYLQDGTYYLYFQDTDNNIIEFMNSDTYYLQFIVDRTTTGISETSIYGVDTGVATKIFSIDGRYVGTDNKTLAPGVYISGGKKFIAR